MIPFRYSVRGGLHERKTDVELSGCTSIAAGGAVGPKASNMTIITVA